RGGPDIGESIVVSSAPLHRGSEGPYAYVTGKYSLLLDSSGEGGEGPVPNPPRRSAVDRLSGIPSLSGWGSAIWPGRAPRSVWAGARSERWGIHFEVVVPVHLVAGVPGIPGIGGSRADPPAGLGFPGGAAPARVLGRSFCASRPFCAGRSFCAGRGPASTACAFCEFRDIAVPGQLLHRCRLGTGREAGLEDSAVPIEAALHHQPLSRCPLLPKGFRQSPVLGRLLLREAFGLVALANRRFAGHQLQHRRCWWNHLSGDPPTFRAHVGQGRELESLGNVDRLVGRRDLGGEPVPELVVELPGIGHSDPQETGGLERVVLGAYRLDVAE